MRRDQLEHAIRAACQIIDADEVIVVGSQAILGSLPEDQLPPEATMSLEIDILPIAPDEATTTELADRIEGVAGEWSSFEELHGFSIDGVSLTTAALPAGWRARLVKVANDNTTADDGQRRFTGWCLERHDLCVAIITAGLVDKQTIAARLEQLDPWHAAAAERAKTWIQSWA